MPHPGKHTTLALGFAMALLASTSTAIAGPVNPISGAFSMTGGLSELTGTHIDFSPFIGLTGNFTVSNSVISGTFAGILSAGDVGTIKDFKFKPLPAGGIPDFFTVKSVTFDLSTVTIELQKAAFLVLSGTGVFSVPGFDDTPGVWNFSANRVSGTFSWSASTASAPVPEPGTWILLGLGFAWIGILVWKTKS